MFDDRDVKLKQHLWAAAERAAPDPLERILAACGEQHEKEEQRMEHMEQTGKSGTGGKHPQAVPAAKKRWMTFTAAMLAVLVGLGIGVQSWRSGHAVASVVSLDVNPSIQLQVNRKERVLSAEPLNAEAWDVLRGMELEGTQLNVAVNAIVGSLLQHGYLTDLGSAILISVEDRDPQRAGRLEAELNQSVSAVVENAVVHSQVLAYDAGQEPEPEGISSGKAALVRAIQNLNGALSFEDLAALSVEELWQLRDADAPGLPIGLGEAAYAAQAYANVLEVDSFVWEADAELDETPAHYEVELYQPYNEDLKYEYLVDAYTGEILEGLPNILQISMPEDIYNGGQTASDTPAAGTGSGTKSLIGEARAKSVALDHAGLQESGVRYCNAWLEYDDGRMEHYEVEFGTDSARYEYEIGLYDGAVLKSEQKVFTAPSASGTGTTGGGTISEERAREIACGHAGVRTADAVVLKSKLDWEDGVQVYELEFQAGNTKYEYEIAAVGGAVVKAERETKASGTVSGTGTTGGGTISEERAREIACGHAGVRTADAVVLKSKLDWEDGVQVYELEFQAGSGEYEYEINALDGTILKSERKEIYTAASGEHHGGRQSSYIGDAAAQAAALSHAGVAAGDARAMKCELDEDDGRCLYEVEFKAGAVEYEYEIDAVTGAVLKAERED